MASPAPSSPGVRRGRGRPSNIKKHMDGIAEYVARKDDEIATLKRKVHELELEMGECRAAEQMFETTAAELLQAKDDLRRLNGRLHATVMERDQLQQESDMIHGTLPLTGLPLDYVKQTYQLAAGGAALLSLELYRRASEQQGGAGGYVCSPCVVCSEQVHKPGIMACCGNAAIVCESCKGRCGDWCPMCRQQLKWVCIDTRS